MVSALQKVPVPSSVFATAQTASSAGRKTWHSAILRASPDGPVYATGKALFIVPRQQQRATAGPQTSAVAQCGAPPEPSAGAQAPAGQLSPQAAQVPLAGESLAGCDFALCPRALQVQGSKALADAQGPCPHCEPGVLMSSLLLYCSSFGAIQQANHTFRHRAASHTLGA